MDLNNVLSPADPQTTISDWMRSIDNVDDRLPPRPEGGRDEPDPDLSSDALGEALGTPMLAEIIALVAATSVARRRKLGKMPAPNRVGKTYNSARGRVGAMSQDAPSRVRPTSEQFDTVPPNSGISDGKGHDESHNGEVDSNDLDGPDDRAISPSEYSSVIEVPAVAARRVARRTARWPARGTDELYILRSIQMLANPQPAGADAIARATRDLEQRYSALYETEAIVRALDKLLDPYVAIQWNNSAAAIKDARMKTWGRELPTQIS